MHMHLGSYTWNELCLARVVMFRYCSGDLKAAMYLKSGSFPSERDHL